jgi:hypothetical protein
MRTRSKGPTESLLANSIGGGSFGSCERVDAKAVAEHGGAASGDPSTRKPRRANQLT